MSADIGGSSLVRIIFEYGFDERDEAEAEIRGCQSHVWAELDDGSRHPLTFYDLARLSQTLADECSQGRMFFTEPGLVLVPAVTRINMEAAARTLAREGFFAHRALAGGPATPCPAEPNTT